MIRSIGAAWRGRRLEAQAAMWVQRMIDDPAANAEGLRRWVGRNQARADLYNSAYRAIRESAAPAKLLFGDVAERASWSAPPSNRQSGRDLGFAVAFVLILGGAGMTYALGMLNGLFRVPATGPTVTAPVLVATKIGEIRRFRLPDGSHVTLDTNSVLHVAINAQSRAVQLDRGRARFQVANDSDLPFVVSAGGGTITAHDTMFDVAVYRTVKVSLLSGDLDFQYPAAAPNKRRPLLRLTAGQQVGYDPTMSEGPPPPSRTRASDAQWVAGMRTFDDIPVSDIIEEANRYSTVRIELADPSLGQRLAFLDLDLRNTKDVARNLATYLGLTVDDTHPGVLVLRPAR